MLSARAILDAEVSNSLIKAGIPTNLQGFYYLKDAIIIAIENPELLHSLTKRMYPEIGRKYNSTSSLVERNMRHAIEVSFRNDGLYLLNEQIRNTYHVLKEKPSNGLFISLCAEIVKKDIIKAAASTQDGPEKEQLLQVTQIFSKDDDEKTEKEEKKEHA